MDFVFHLLAQHMGPRQDGGQHIPATCDLLLIPGTEGLVLYRLLETLVRGINPLDFIGGLDTLYLGDLHQFGQCIGLGLDKQGLFALVLVDLSQQGTISGVSSFS